MSKRRVNPTMQSCMCRVPKCGCNMYFEPTPETNPWLCEFCVRNAHITDERSHFMTGNDGDDMILTICPVGCEDHL